MRCFGLIGFPLEHSFSASYFSEKFRNSGINDCEYRLYPIEKIDLFPNLIQGNDELMGLNVTIPYKQTIIPFLHELSPDASKIGAVNCIAIHNQRLIGHNTDAYGFHQSIKPFLEPQHDRALILGTGGASKAVAFVLESIGINYLFVSRTPKGNQQIDYNAVNENLLRHHKLIINTTPLGTFPKTEESPQISTEWFTSDHFVVDLIYNPEETVLLKNAKHNGALTLNGLSMLQQQAEKSWEIWNS